MCWCKAKNEWQDNLSLIVLSKLVLYIHISSFRVRFYEKKSKMTCVRVFFFVIFFECSQIARAGVQGGRPRTRCFVIMAYLITPLRRTCCTALHRDKLCRDFVAAWLCLQLLACQRLERCEGDTCISISNQPLHTPLPHNYNHDRTYAYQKGVE